MADGAFAAIDPAKTYIIVSNNFVRNGGDGFKMVRDAANAYDFGPDVADVVAGYLAAAGLYAALTDERITAEQADKTVQGRHGFGAALSLHGGGDFDLDQKPGAGEAGHDHQR